MAEKFARKKKFVDWNVQGTLLVRAVFYWAMCILNTGLVLLCWQIIVAPPGNFTSFFRFDLLWIDYRAALIASLFTLPIILIDVLNISHRFVGPNCRFRRAMRELAEGKEVDLIRFRGGDFWQEMAEEFNAVAIYVEKLKRQAGVVNTPAADREEGHPASAR